MRGSTPRRRPTIAQAPVRWTREEIDIVAEMWGCGALTPEIVDRLYELGYRRTRRQVLSKVDALRVKGVSGLGYRRGQSQPLQPSRPDQLGGETEQFAESRTVLTTVAKKSKLPKTPTLAAKPTNSTQLAVVPNAPLTTPQESRHIARAANSQPRKPVSARKRSGGAKRQRDKARSESIARDPTISGRASRVPSAQRPSVPASTPADKRSAPDSRPQPASGQR